MIVDGEKYACEACVRGHRVSTCQHADRPLIHINKKGRPVSQCPHCRGLRKSRGTHPACECGFKSHAKEECTSAAETSESEANSDTGDNLPLQRPRQRARPRSNPCCCTHGQKCTCALKRDHLDTVPEVDVPAVPLLRRTSSKKPKFTKSGSESTLTVFANGHHKPVHKHNDAAHQSGMPYKIPIPHSISGNADVARRSTDSLLLNRRRPSPHTASLRLSSGLRSSHNSPPQSALSPTHPLPFDFSTYIPGPQPLRVDDYPTPTPSYQAFSPVAPSSPFSPAMTPTANTLDWSAFNKRSAFYNPLQSLGSMDQPAPFLSNLSSGNVSDISDYWTHPAASGNNFYQRPDLALSTPGSEDFNINPNRLSSTSFLSTDDTYLPPLALDLGPSLGQLGSAYPSEIDEELSSLFDANVHEIRTPATPLTESPVPPPLALPSHMTSRQATYDAHSRSHALAHAHGPALNTKHGFTVHEAQKMAHPDGPALFVGTDADADEDEARSHIWTENASPEHVATYVGLGAEGADDWT